MAIARGNFAIGALANPGSSCTATINNVAGDLMIFFHIHRFDGGETSTGADWNGTAATHIGTSNAGNVAPRFAIDSYYLIAPATGSHTATATVSASVQNQLWVVAYSGTKQSAQPDGHDELTGVDGTSLSSNITVNAVNSWVVALGYQRSSLAVATGSGVVSKVLEDETLASILMDSNGPIGAGSQAYGFTGATGSNNTALIGVSIAPVFVAAARNDLSLLGVG